MSFSFCNSAGSGDKGNVPRQQEDGQPGEDAHHLQQRQGLEVTAGPEQRPEGQQHPLCAGECLPACRVIRGYLFQSKALTGVNEPGSK